MRYFFNIIEAGIEIPDPEGMDLPGPDAAQKEALAIAFELRAEFPGRFGRHGVIEVLSEAGQCVFASPIAAPAL